MKNKGLFCSLGGCNRSAKIRGWCTKHYMRWLRWGDPTITKKAAILPYGEAAKNLVIRSYRSGAEARNLEFSLSDEEILSLTQQNCYYCDSAPSQVATSNGDTGDYIYNGIDRLDNNVGYTPENCVPCCKRCNEWKRAIPEEEFLAHIMKIATNYG